MIPVLLLATLFLTVWQVFNWYTNRHKYQQLMLIQQQLQNYTLQSNDLAALQETTHNLLNFYHALGQSIAALHIQLQVAQKLWQTNPTQAQRSLFEAYQLSSTLMHEVRQTVRNMDRASFK